MVTARHTTNFLSFIWVFKVLIWVPSECKFLVSVPYFFFSRVCNVESKVYVWPPMVVHCFRQILSTFFESEYFKSLVLCQAHGGKSGSIKCPVTLSMCCFCFNQRWTLQKYTPLVYMEYSGGCCPSNMQLVQQCLSREKSCDQREVTRIVGKVPNRKFHNTRDGHLKKLEELASCSWWVRSHTRPLPSKLKHCSI